MTMDQGHETRRWDVKIGWKHPYINMHNESERWQFYWYYYLSCYIDANIPSFTNIRNRAKIEKSVKEVIQLNWVGIGGFLYQTPYFIGNGCKKLKNSDSSVFILLCQIWAPFPELHRLERGVSSMLWSNSRRHRVKHENIFGFYT